MSTTNNPRKFGDSIPCTVRQGHFWVDSADDAWQECNRPGCTSKRKFPTSQPQHTHVAGAHTHPDPIKFTPGSHTHTIESASDLSCLLTEERALQSALKETITDLNELQNEYGELAAETDKVADQVKWDPDSPLSLSEHIGAMLLSDSQSRHVLRNQVDILREIAHDHETELAQRGDVIKRTLRTTHVAMTVVICLSCLTALTLLGVGGVLWLWNLLF